MKFIYFGNKLCLVIPSQRFPSHEYELTFTKNACVSLMNWVRICLFQPFGGTKLQSISFNRCCFYYSRFKLVPLVTFQSVLLLNKARKSLFYLLTVILNLLRFVSRLFEKKKHSKTFPFFLCLRLRRRFW